MKTIDVQVCSKSTPWQGQGIGDVIQMLPVIAGVQAANQDAKVRAVVCEYNMPWALLGCQHVVDSRSAYQKGDVELWPHRDVLETDLQCIARNTNRQALWAANLGVLPVPVVPRISASESQRADELVADNGASGKPLAWVAPYAAIPARTWARRRWAEVVAGLQDAGCVVLGMQCHYDPPAIRWLGCSVLQPDGAAELSAALLSRGSLFIGNDSGLTHLAGWMGIPSIAVCGMTTGRVVFGCYPSVWTLEDTMDCKGCIGRPAKGWRPWCSASCDALDSIQARDLLELAARLLHKWR